MRRAVRSIIRLLAAGIIVIGGLVVILDWTRYRLHREESGSLAGLLALFAIAAGVVLFATSTRLAARFTDDADE